MQRPKPKIAIFASGRGSNAEALMHAFERDLLPAQLALVFSNKPQAAVLELATKHGYPCACIPNEGHSRQAHEGLVLETLKQAEIDHVVLAGYMRILTPEFLNGFKSQGGDAIINIHPSLLPDFPGLHSIERQHEAGVVVAGATVHHVIDQVDAGPIILQGSLEVRGDESIEELGRRIREEVEHFLYPRALRLFLDRRYAEKSQSPQNQKALL